MLLRKALMDCEACKIAKPMCTDVPYPCFEVMIMMMTIMMMMMMMMMMIMMVMMIMTMIMIIMMMMMMMFQGPPRVDCRDTVEGPECGPCPPGYKVSQITRHT